MALLDSLLAFALTLAALASVVTLLLEVLIRLFGLKRKGQVRIISRLLDDTVKDYLPAGEPRWQVVKAILQNPFADKAMATKPSEQKYGGTAAAGIYAEVSLEHILRRFLETSAAADLVSQAEEQLKAKLQIIAQKYDEYSSALSADFKRNAQRWSIVIGITAAVLMNIDGLRILEAYLQGPALRQSVIEKLQIPENGEAAPEDEQADTEAAGDGTAPTGETAEGNSPENNGQAEGNETESAVDPDEVIAELKGQLGNINDLALPIGSAYFPHCYLSWDKASRGDSGDPLCKTADGQKTIPAFLLWLVKVFATGLLIGLGAPFWYDVARRLAAVRSAFNGKGSPEEQHSGSDATASLRDRETLIDRIAKEAKATQGAAQPSGGTAG